MEKYTICIDFGTLSGICLLVDVASGKEVAASVYEYPHGVIEGSLPYGRKLPNDWYLQHPKDYLEVLENTVEKTLDEAGVKPEQVIGIGVDFTACTMLPITEDGTPLCMLEKYRSDPNAYVKLWKHHSAQPQADRLTRVAQERKENFIKRYGGKISSEWMLPKILQTLEESPDVYRDTYTFLEAGDWIVLQLTGKLMRNSCAAGAKCLWHKKSGFPSKEYFKAVHPGLENVVEDKLKGPVVSIGTRAGLLTEAGAALTGLSAGTPVAVAHLDAHGATIGAKVV